MDWVQKHKQKLTGLIFGLGFTLFPAISLAADACTGATAVGASCDKSGFEANLTNIFNTIFFIVGALAVLIILVGAIRYVTSTGDAKRIQAAKDTILYAVIGLVVAILAREIVGFVIGSLF